MSDMEPTIIAYVAGFLDGDGSIFFQIVRRKDYKRKFQIRTSIAFYQKSENAEILDWLKEIFQCGYIRRRKTGISDYTIVDSREVLRILELLRPYVRVKKKQVELGIRILKKMQAISGNDEFLEACGMVDEFKGLNYSKKRTVTKTAVSVALSP